MSALTSRDIASDGRRDYFNSLTERCALLLPITNLIWCDFDQRDSRVIPVASVLAIAKIAKPSFHRRTKELLDLVLVIRNDGLALLSDKRKSIAVYELRTNADRNPVGIVGVVEGHVGVRVFGKSVRITLHKMGLTEFDLFKFARVVAEQSIQ